MFEDFLYSKFSIFLRTSQNLIIINTSYILIFRIFVLCTYFVKHHHSFIQHDRTISTYFIKFLIRHHYLSLFLTRSPQPYICLWQAHCEVWKMRSAQSIESRDHNRTALIKFHIFPWKHHHTNNGRIRTVYWKTDSKTYWIWCIFFYLDINIYVYICVNKQYFSKSINKCVYSVLLNFS